MTGCALMRRPFAAFGSGAAILFTTIAAVGAAHAADVSYEFAPQPQGARSWLAAEGFEFKLDADDTSRARLSLGAQGLQVETLAPAEPLIARPNLNVAQPARLSTAWGVSRYPVGANWDTGANNEAIMVMVSFGTEKFPGGLFRPPSPYFIGFFLCDSGHRGVPISGRSYTMQGRYICVDGPPPGKQITTVIDLDEQFRRAFQKPAPPVTGLAIEADTTQVAAGRSSAWIKSIEIAGDK
jgi:hypothetical protein